MSRSSGRIWRTEVMTTEDTAGMVEGGVRRKSERTGAMSMALIARQTGVICLWRRIVGYCRPECRLYRGGPARSSATNRIASGTVPCKKRTSDAGAGV